MIMFFCLFHFSLVLRYNFPSFFLGLAYYQESLMFGVLVVLKDKTYAFIMYSHCVCLPQIGDMKRLISLQPLKNCSVLFQFWKCVDGLKLGGCFLVVTSKFHAKVKNKKVYMKMKKLKIPQMRITWIGHVILESCFGVIT